MAEWFKAPDLKSGVFCTGGSNPSLSSGYFILKSCNPMTFLSTVYKRGVIFGLGLSVAKLADAIGLGSIGQLYEFESHHSKKSFNLI